MLYLADPAVLALHQSGQMLHLAGPMLHLTGSMLHLAEPMLHLAGPSSWANVTLGQALF